MLHVRHDINRAQSFLLPLHLSGKRLNKRATGLMQCVSWIFCQLPLFSPHQQVLNFSFISNVKHRKKKNRVLWKWFLQRKIRYLPVLNILPLNFSLLMFKSIPIKSIYLNIVWSGSDGWINQTEVLPNANPIKWSNLVL